MAKVDFHSQVGDKVHYACRLIRKINSLAKEDEPFQTIVVLGPLETLNQLNEQLWTFSSDDFLPHCFAGEESAELSPILLLDIAQVAVIEDLSQQDVLIHMGQEALENIVDLTQRFGRVVEVVSTEPTDLLAGRARYKHYRELGLELQNFDQKGTK